MSLTNYRTATIDSTNYNKIKSTKNIYDKSRIYRGSVHTGENKTNFGSIPRKDEIFLIKKNKYEDRFNSGNSNIYYTDTETFPGAGTYNISNNFILNKYNSISLSSNSIRFNSNFDNQVPGVGNYNLSTLNNNSHNYRYKSLFKESSSKNLIRNDSNSKNNSDKNKENNVDFYNSVDLHDISLKKKKLNFNSYSGRDNYSGSNSFFDNRNINPGPGSYFKNNINDDISKSVKNIYNSKTFKKDSYSILQSEAKKIIKEMNKNNDNEKEEEMNFKLLNGKNYPNQKVYSVKEITDSYIDNNSPKPLYYQKKKDISKNKLYTESDIPYVSFKINEERELKYIKDFLGNENGKPDVFYLNSPRWKFYEKKYQFKVPGPAYYFSENNY